MPAPKPSDDFIDHALRFIVREGKAFGLKAGRVLFAGRRRQIVTASVAAAVVVALIGTVSVVSYVNEQAAIAKQVAADERLTVANAAAEVRAKAAEKKRLEEALVNAKAYAVAVSAQAVKAAADAAAYADPTVLQEVETARLASDEAAKGSNTAAIDAAGRAVATAIEKIGTLEDSQDRAYMAARSAAGKDVSTPSSAISVGRKTCTDLDTYYKDDVMKATAALIEHRSTVDVSAIQIYCPQYQPALDAVSGMIPKGKFAVGESATPLGSAGSQIAAGTYAIPRASDCYWARSTSSGEIIANDFIGNAPGPVSVTIYAGEGFETSGCATWVRQ